MAFNIGERENPYALFLVFCASISFKVPNKMLLVLGGRPVVPGERQRIMLLWGDSDIDPSSISAEYFLNETWCSEERKTHGIN